MNIHLEGCTEGGDCYRASGGSRTFRLNARRSPMFNLFLTRWISQLLGLALVSWAFARIGVHHPSLRLPYFMFPIRSYLPLDFNRVSSLRSTYRQPFGRPFTYSLFRWVSRIGTGSGTRCCGPRGGTAVRMEQKIDQNFCPGRDTTSDLGILTTAHPSF